MKEKIKILFGSLRFWTVTLGFVTVILEQILTGDLTLAYFFDAFQVYAGVVAGIGTLDSIASNVAGNK